MEKNNKMEIIGLVLMTIGGLFWLSEKYYIIEQLNSIYSWARIVLFLGLAIWALGLMKKEDEKRKQKETDKALNQ
jgi:cytosine/uracil/thiamine/allantoin permease